MKANELYKILKVKQHSELENKLKQLIFNKQEREQFYKSMINNTDLSIDSFREYFEQYSAERKSNMQDYTPDEVANLLSMLTRTNGITGQAFAGADFAGGTGSLIIKKWNDDKEMEQNYNNSAYVYLIQEYADNVIPYLLHNMAMRNINCVVIHGDTLTKNVKAIYFLQENEKFSDINVMPNTKEVEKYFNVKFIEEKEVHIESEYKQIDIEVSSTKKQLPICLSKTRPFLSQKMKQLKEYATIERAIQGKTYQKGTIIVQISATQGQIGMLTSNGSVESKYACIKSNGKISDKVLFYAMKQIAPRYFHGVKENINIKLEDIKRLPIPQLSNNVESIVEALLQIDEAHDLVLKEIEELKTFKNVMLDVMFV